MADAPMALSFWRRVRVSCAVVVEGLRPQAAATRPATTNAERRSMGVSPRNGIRQHTPRQVALPVHSWRFSMPIRYRLLALSALLVFAPARNADPVLRGYD